MGDGSVSEVARSLPVGAAGVANMEPLVGNVRSFQWKASAMVAGISMHRAPVSSRCIGVNPRADRDFPSRQPALNAAINLRKLLFPACSIPPATGAHSLSSRSRRVPLRMNAITAPSSAAHRIKHTALNANH